MSEEKQHFNPNDLQLLFEVPTEDTMEEFIQVIKFAKNVKTGKIWMFIDRIHKKDRSQSKPAAYVQLINTQLLELAQVVSSILLKETKYLTIDVLFDWIKNGVRI